jgi:23S rRNA (uridine2552-2'-O)-methyltransferase
MVTLFQKFLWVEPFNEIVAEGKKYFKEVKVFKPKSSRKDSKESFIICSKLR